MSRAPNQDESRLHQAALEAKNQELSAKDAEAIVPDPKTRQNALNFLLSVGMIKSLADNRGRVSFRAISKAELSVTKGLGGEENLVLGHIKAAKSEGLWTKHLKAKTNLHQTVIDRCLKTLTQKKLIKRVPSVQHPTRKIYMLEGYEPSIALTGGPWYTDNELDVEFIKTLTSACLKFIQDVSFPKNRTGDGIVLYPISNAPQYPSAQNIRRTLQQARLTETELSEEHVEMLLNVLVLDGEIERIPAFGSALWDSQVLRDADSDEDERNVQRMKKRKMRHTSSDSDDTPSSGRKKRRRDYGSSEGSHSEGESRSRGSSKRRRSKVDSDIEETLPQSSRKSKKRKTDSSGDEDSQSENDRPLGSKSKTIKRESSPFQSFSFDELDGASRFVYRAIRPEQLSIGWNQAPCSQCPSFDFCKDGGPVRLKDIGPVNPRECVYYGGWLTDKIVQKAEEN